MPDHAEALAEALRPFAAVGVLGQAHRQAGVMFRDDNGEWRFDERATCGLTIGDFYRLRAALAAYDAAKQKETKP